MVYQFFEPMVDFADGNGYAKSKDVEVRGKIPLRKELKVKIHVRPLLKMGV